MIMLATVEIGLGGTVGKPGAAPVIDVWRFAFVVRFRLVGRGQVMQRQHVAPQRRREGVGGKVLTPLGPHRIARNTVENLKTAHELHHPARFEGLSGTIIPGAAILIPAESPARHLAILTHDDRKSTRLNSSHLGISYAV